MNNTLYNQLVAMVWANRSFRARLLNDPRSALKELNVHVSAELQVKVIEEGSNTMTLVIPAEPEEGDLYVEY